MVNLYLAVLDEVGKVVIWSTVLLGKHSLHLNENALAKALRIIGFDLSYDTLLTAHSDAPVR